MDIQTNRPEGILRMYWLERIVIEEDAILLPVEYLEAA